jgi:hypothetical protein
MDKNKRKLIQDVHIETSDGSFRRPPRTSIIHSGSPLIASLCRLKFPVRRHFKKKTECIALGISAFL